MKSWHKSGYDAILNFPKNYLISNYLGVTLSSCNMLIKVKLFCGNADRSDYLKLSSLKN